MNIDGQDKQDFPEGFHHQGTKGTKKTRPAGRWRYGERPFFVPPASRRPRPHLILCILSIREKNSLVLPRVRYRVHPSR